MCHQGPMTVSPPLTLENLNHHLYGGLEDFQGGFRVSASPFTTSYLMSCLLSAICCFLSPISCPSPR